MYNLKVRKMFFIGKWWWLCAYKCWDLIQPPPPFSRLNSQLCGNPAPSTSGPAPALTLHQLPKHPTLPNSSPAPAPGPPSPTASHTRTCFGQPAVWYQPQDFLSPTTSCVRTSPCPPLGGQHLQEARPGSQPGSGSAPPTSASTVFSPTTTEGPTRATWGKPLEHIGLVARGEYVMGSHRTSPTKRHFSKIGKCNRPI